MLQQQNSQLSRPSESTDGEIIVVASEQPAQTDLSQWITPTNTVDSAQLGPKINKTKEVSGAFSGSGKKV